MRLGNTDHVAKAAGEAPAPLASLSVQYYYHMISMLLTSYRNIIESFLGGGDG